MQMSNLPWSPVSTTPHAPGPYREIKIRMRWGVWSHSLITWQGKEKRGLFGEMWPSSQDTGPPYQYWMDDALRTMVLWHQTRPEDDISSNQALQGIILVTFPWARESLYGIEWVHATNVETISETIRHRASLETEQFSIILCILNRKFLTSRNLTMAYRRHTSFTAMR